MHGAKKDQETNHTDVKENKTNNCGERISLYYTAREVINAERKDVGVRLDNEGSG